MSNEVILVRGIMGKDRQNFATFSIVDIRQNGDGKQYRVDINRVKGETLYKEKWDVLDAIIREAKQRGWKASAYLRGMTKNLPVDYPREVYVEWFPSAFD